MIQQKNSFFPIAMMITVWLVVGAFDCGKKMSEDDMIKHDHKAIAAILEKALLSEKPEQEFANSLQKVRTYPSVDSAWISGPTFFVRYKQGGVVSWTVPPPIHQPGNN